MSPRERRNVGAAMRTALGGPCDPAEDPLPAALEAPASAPRSGERPIAAAPPATLANPLGSGGFRALRELRSAFGRGGLPPRDRRTPEDEARIVAFFVLAELTHILDQFRRAIEQGERRRLVVREHGRQLGKVVIEITIEGRDA